MVLKQISKSIYPDHTETSETSGHKTESLLNFNPSIQPWVVLSKSQIAVQSSDQANFL